MEFLINGYWKDDKEQFEDYLVITDVCNNYSDDEVFFVFEDEQEIIEAIEQGFNSDYDFVITSYKKGDF